MGRTILIAVLAVAAVCALKATFRRAAVGTRPVAAAAGATDATALNRAAAEPVTPQQAPLKVAVPEPPTSEEQTAEVSIIVPNNAAEAHDGIQNPGETEATEMMPVEAIILKEEENGRVVFQAPAPDDFAAHLSDVAQNHPLTGNWDLLSLFRAELDGENKQAILSTSSLLPHDQNTWLLLQLAMADSQPADIRASAAAFAVEQRDRNPDLVLQHLTDPDPLVHLTIENAFLDIEPTTQIVGQRITPDHTLLPAAQPNAGN